MALLKTNPAALTLWEYTVPELVSSLPLLFSSAQSYSGTCVCTECLEQNKNKTVAGKNLKLCKKYVKSLNGRISCQKESIFYGMFFFRAEWLWS